MRVRGSIAFLIVLGACGGSTAPSIDAGPSSSGSVPKPTDAAGASTSSSGGSGTDASSLGAGIACDETTDCEGGSVCCAEDGDAPRTIVTRCLPSCITNNPRVQVCKRDEECESKACRRYDCGPTAPALRYCDRPERCR